MSYFTFDDISGSPEENSGGKGKSQYTLEEIEAAKKRQKKYGGSIMENLEIIHAKQGGKPVPSLNPRETAASKSASSKPAASASAKPASKKPAASGTKSMWDNPPKKPQGSMWDTPASSLDSLEFLKENAKRTQETLDAMKEHNKRAQDSLDTLNRMTAVNTADISASIKELNANLAKDFGPTVAASAAQPAVLTDEKQILDAFAGLSDALKERIYGQDEFLKKLTISFKRPYVSERDHNDALNSIYITGPACTGKHYALQTLAEELHQRHVLKSPKICTIDLSLYPNAAEEKLFLQDLYAALQSDSSLLLFENIEGCHISMLTRLSDLVSTGECKLSERYIMQNGQLVNVANAFAGNTIGSFEAKGKFLIFISSKPVDKLAGIMGAPFVNALGDICETKELDEEALKRISGEHEKQLIAKCQKQLSYEVTVEESFRAYVLSQTSKSRALRGILNTYADTLRALTELRLERDDLSGTALSLQCKEEQPIVVIGEEELSVLSLLPGSYNGELDSVKAELSAIVGLKAVKEYIYGLEEYFDVQKRRREAGLKAGELNKHMIFTGNPGTGKTTIARIVSKYLKAIGVLSGGQLVEVSRADLVGRYVGHTAPLVNQVVKSALGGVLFIDEAYSLYRGGDDSFGLEAIDTLVKGIEDNRDDLIVILAGYSKEMADFLEANSGLKSRFPNIIDFPDYTAEELLAIGRLTAKSKGYVIDASAEQPLLDYFTEVQATRAMDAGNGRLVRNKLEEAILNQSRRLVAEKDADMTLLLECDFDFTD